MNCPNMLFPRISSDFIKGYGCCPYQNAVCCKDGKSCCPHGMKCDLERLTCDLNVDESPNNEVNVETDAKNISLTQK